ncbi:MAG: DUF4179 domain-containing protein [Bacillota bacterium]
MNCPTTDKLAQWMDELLPKQEQSMILAHLENCERCKDKIKVFSEEQRFINETLMTPSLPDEFADTILNQLEPYEPKKARLQKRAPWKRVMLLAAGMVLAVGLTTTLNPSFAEWIGGLFSTEQVDEGLRMASDAGLAKRVNLEVRNHGLTFKVEDVLADSSRVALSYQIINENGKVKDSYLDLGDSPNEITAIDQNGNKIELLSMAWSETSEYGLIEFSLREQGDLEKLTIKFSLSELDGKKGNWELEVPVDLKENLNLTKNLVLKDAKTNRNGVSINLKEVQFAPSSNEILYETSFTSEEQKKVETQINKLEEKFGTENVNSFSHFGTAIQYHIENRLGNAIYYHNAFLQQGHTSDRGLLQGTGRPLETLGQVAWNESFIPQKEEDQLTFVLDGVIKTVPSDFSIKINPKELGKNPISFEYEGNYMTINKARKENQYSLRKSFFPIEKETVFTIEMEGSKEAPSSEMGAWVIVDDKGNPYLTYHRGSILDEKDEHGRFKTNTELITYDMEEIPEELTLHLLSVTRYEAVKDKWEVPLYEGE